MSPVPLQLVLQQEFHLNLSLSATASVIRMFDRRRCGALDRDGWRETHDFLKRVRANFEYFDTSPRSGTLTREEVREALKHNGVDLEGPVFERCFVSFDPNGTGSMGLAEFVILSVFLETSRATFRAFDKQDAGTVTLDMQQFIYAAANMR